MLQKNALSKIKKQWQKQNKKKTTYTESYLCVCLLYTLSVQYV